MYRYPQSTQMCVATAVSSAPAGVAFARVVSASACVVTAGSRATGGERRLNRLALAPFGRFSPPSDFVGPGAGRGRGRARGRHRRPSRRRAGPRGSLHRRDRVSRRGKVEPASREGHPGPHRQRDGRQHTGASEPYPCARSRANQNRVGIWDERRLKRTVFLSFPSKRVSLDLCDARHLTPLLPRARHTARRAQRTPIPSSIAGRSSTSLAPVGVLGAVSKTSSEDRWRPRVPARRRRRGDAGRGVDRAGDNPRVVAVVGSGDRLVVRARGDVHHLFVPVFPASPATPSSVSPRAAGAFGLGGPSPVPPRLLGCPLHGFVARWRSRGRYPRDVRVQRRHRNRLARLQMRGNPGTVFGPELRLGRRVSFSNASMRTSMLRFPCPAAGTPCRPWTRASSVYPAAPSASRASPRHRHSRLRCRRRGEKHRRRRRKRAATAAADPQR